jgi:transposase
VQGDESYFGGYKRGGGTGRGSNNKTAVFGVVECKGKVKSQKVENVKRTTLFPLIEKYVAKGSTITTDELNSYKILSQVGYNHQVVQHRLRQYVNEQGNTTNTIEGWWSILKRSISSTHVWVSPKYLDRYIDEFEFRYNNRHSEVPMFELIIQNVSRPLYKVDTDTGEITLFDGLE